MTFYERMWIWRDKAGTVGSSRLAFGVTDPVTPYVWDVLWDRFRCVREPGLFGEINA